MSALARRHFLAPALVMALLAAACSGDSGKRSAAEPTPPAGAGQIERSVSLASGGALSLAGDATVTVKSKSGSGTSTLRLARVSAPSEDVNGAPWLVRAGNLIELSNEEGDFPKGVELQLKLLKGRLPADAGEDQIFVAQIENGVLHPQPTKVNMRTLIATVTVSEAGTFGAFVVRPAELRSAILESWRAPGEGTPVAAAGASGCGGAGSVAALDVCVTPPAAASPMEAKVEAVNRRALYFEVGAEQSQGVSAAPAAGAAVCETGVALAPLGRATWQVTALDDTVRSASLALVARVTPCSQFVQAANALLAPVLGVEAASLTPSTSAWYGAANGNPLLRAATTAWEGGDRAGWAASLATFLMNPSNLQALSESLTQSGHPMDETTLRNQVFTAGDVMDALAGAREALAFDEQAARDPSLATLPVKLSFSGPAVASVERTARLVTAGRGAAAGEWYLHGANVPWLNWGCDFGCAANGGVSSAASRETMGAAFKQAQAAGMHVIRWWTFEGDVWQINRDATGAPTGINPAVYADFDAALQLAETYDLYFVFTLFNAPTAIPELWMIDPEQRAKLAAVLGQLFARYRGNPRVLAWDVVNEPEWDLANQKVDKPSLKETVKAIADSVHANSTARVTVVAAMLIGLENWTGLGLDFYAANWYDPMPREWCSRCTDYATVRARYDLDKPLVIGEFYAGPDVDARDRFYDFYAKGYAGAWAWSLLPDKTADHMAVDFAAAAAFAAEHPDTGPRAGAKAPTRSSFAPPTPASPSPPGGRSALAPAANAAPIGFAVSQREQAPATGQITVRVSGLSVWDAPATVALAPAVRAAVPISATEATVTFADLPAGTYRVQLPSVACEREVSLAANQRLVVQMSLVPVDDGLRCNTSVLDPDAPPPPRDFPVQSPDP